ncbi:uncharacterized protein LAJ45_01985 [Morchella importuna]|uniref:uncharacterized protein n=1 Tax=Morchella importuna TaxID=1174673 RepID=UPI001E8D4158|nr:uncharacterized protein LAJ45_01985 [Morchella importuna]KAH8154217.1 hypothetical protein LAJ45_01985 [Morchella importuna]
MTDIRVSTGSPTDQTLVAPVHNGIFVGLVSQSRHPGFAMNIRPPEIVPDNKNPETNAKNRPLQRVMT